MTRTALTHFSSNFHRSGPKTPHLQSGATTTNLQARIHVATALHLVTVMIDPATTAAAVTTSTVDVNETETMA